VFTDTNANDGVNNRYCVHHLSWYLTEGELGLLGIIVAPLFEDPWTVNVVEFLRANYIFPIRK
jgi:hypothetical protein